MPLRPVPVVKESLANSAPTPDPAPVGNASSDSLLLFAPENGPSPQDLQDLTTGTIAPAQARLWRVAAWVLLAASSLLVLTAGAYFTYTRWTSRQRPAPQLVRVTLDTQPTGANVFIDDQPRGVTPIALMLSPGNHMVRLRREAIERALPIHIVAGAEVAHYIELSDPSLSPAPASRTSAISVVTDPPGARVSIDGQPRGTSPVTVMELSAAHHVIAVTSATGSAQRAVTTEAGATTSVVFSLPVAPASPVAPAASTGWLAVSAPFEVLASERNEVVGTSTISRIMLPVGRHTITLVSERFDYHEDRDIDIVAGQTTTLRVDVKSQLSVNARPWATVELDGVDMGQTPLAYLVVPVGTHQVIFRHPQFGERHETVDVKTKGPNRVAVDLTK